MNEANATAFKIVKEVEELDNKRTEKKCLWKKEGKRANSCVTYL